jgi:multicomponent Na+:H+ antiporter subunit E
MSGNATPARGFPGGGRSTRGRALAAGCVVFAFWLVISASLAPVDLLLGAVLSGVLGAWSAGFLWAGDAPRLSRRQWLAMLRYLAVYSVQVLHAALHVARLVIDPRMPIHPRLIVCRTSLRSELARVAFAHSVTLTPGTLTVDMDGGNFLVHCLDEASAAWLLNGELERRVARVFEAEDPG